LRRRAALAIVGLMTTGCSPLEARETSPPAAACPVRRLEVPTVGLNLAEEDEGHGFVSDAVQATLRRVAEVGSNSVAFVAVARLPGLTSDAFDHHLRPDRATLQRLVEASHRLGLRVLVVPHIWVDGGLWRGDIVRQGAAADAFFERYRDFLGPLADDAEAACADAL
jgi:hypothetical protein